MQEIFHLVHKKIWYLFKPPDFDYFAQVSVLAGEKKERKREREYLCLIGRFMLAL